MIKSYNLRKFAFSLLLHLFSHERSALSKPDEALRVKPLPFRMRKKRLDRMGGGGTSEVTESVRSELKI